MELISPTNLLPVDYLIIGHVTQDLMDDHTWRLGGTLSYAGLTAAALGRHTQAITSCTPQLDLTPLAPLDVVRIPSAQNTTFRNIQTEDGRRQILFHSAEKITAANFPQIEYIPPIVHLAPVDDEVDPQIYQLLPQSLICLTLQGWLREVDAQGQVKPRKWPYGTELLQAADAIVLSLEDLQGDEAEVQTLAEVCRLLVLTEGPEGARVYWNGDVRRFPAPQVALVEDTGAGDIFAACFFHRLSVTNDPWESARFAVQLASYSVTRRHFASIPSTQEINAALMQVI
jgi:sugar/nucleoside kinase (ribokinase family)